MTDLNGKIKQQIEFYFSDSNLPRDKFLQNIVVNDPNGYVPLATIMTFKRVQSLSTNPEDIINSIKDSSLIELNEDNTMIKRKSPLPEPSRETISRTLHIATFPTTVTLDDLLTFFKNFGTVNCIRMNRNSDREFKGSIYLEMSNKDECDKIISDDISFSGQKLETKEYLEVYLEAKKKKREDKKKCGKKSHDDRDKYPKNCLVKFTNVHESTEREDILNTFRGICDVKYVDFSRGKSEGYLRFPNEVECKKCIEYTEPFVVKDSTLALTLVTGGDETEYINKIRDSRKRKMNNNRMGRQNKKSKVREGDDVHDEDDENREDDE